MSQVDKLTAIHPPAKLAKMLLALRADIYTGRSADIYIFHARRENVDGAGRNVCRGERVFKWGGANVSARYESLSRSVG